MLLVPWVVSYMNPQGWAGLSLVQGDVIEVPLHNNAGVCTGTAEARVAALYPIANNGF